MLLSQATTHILKLIDMYSVRGEVKTATDANTLDYRLKIVSFLNEAQIQIAQVHPIRREFVISQNLPTATHDFTIRQHNDKDITIEDSSAKAYSFAVDDYATVYIEGYTSDSTWELINTIDCYSAQGFTAFNGFIDQDDDYANYRLRFSGNTFYNIKNIALYDVSFSSVAKIPNIAPYIEYTMPADFDCSVSAELRTEDEYRPFDTLRWKNGNILCLPYELSGEVKITYAAKPITVDENTSDDYEFELPESMQNAMCFYAAALMLEHERPDVAARFMSLYQERMINFSFKQTNPTRVKARR